MSLTRRRFIGMGASATAFSIVPRHAVAGSGQTPPSEKLSIAGVGIGGQGYNDLMSVGSENIVALCEVDDRQAARAYQRWPRAKRHRDFRRMLVSQKDIDAVMVATPDNLHFLVSMWALRLGKHVYCQKPLTHTIAEARALAEAASRSKVATQMGNQGNAGEGVRRIQEWIEDGAIGKVREVHCWTNKPECPAGIGGPKETPPVPERLGWICGWDQRRIGRSIPPTTRSSGGPGGISAPVPWATWAAT
ncbi:MAG: Gfo/Idh/MocA family oxidoreductase [Planctomycetota bacterium]